MYILFAEHIPKCASEGPSPSFKARYYYTFLRGNDFAFKNSISRQFLKLGESFLSSLTPVRSYNYFQYALLDIPF